MFQIKLNNKLITFIMFIIANAVTICAQTIIITGMKYLMSDFGVSSATAQLSYSIFLLILGVMIPPSAYIVHRFKIKTILISALSVFFIGSLISFISHNFWIFLIGRVLQAGGTGILIPVTQIILFKVISKEKWSVAMGAFGFIVGIMPALGPTIGGFLIDLFNWRAIFFIFSIVSLLILIFSVIVVKFELETRDYPLDIISLILSVVFCIGIIMGCSNIADYGINIFYVILPIAVGIVSICVFVKRQKSLKFPFINLKVLKNKYFVAGMIFSSLLYYIICSANVIVPLFAQNISYFTATESGLILLPGTLTMVVLNLFSGILADKLGFKRILLISCVFTGISLVLMMNYSIYSSMEFLIVSQIIRCIGVGLGLTPSITWTMGIVAQMVEDATAVNNTVRQLAGAIGSSISTLILAVSANGTITHNINSLSSFNITSFCLLIITVISFGITILYIDNK